MVCYRTDDQVCSYNKRFDCSKRVQRQNRNRIKQVKIWLLQKSYILLKVESIFLLVDFVCLQGIQDIAKTCSAKPIVIFWISCNKFMEMFFREIKHSLNWSVVLVKEKLKTHYAATVKKTIAETQRLLVEKKNRAKRGTAQKFPRQRV